MYAEKNHTPNDIPKLEYAENFRTPKTPNRRNISQNDRRKPRKVAIGEMYRLLLSAIFYDHFVKSYYAFEFLVYENFPRTQILEFPLVYYFFSRTVNV